MANYRVLHNRLNGRFTAAAIRGNTSLDNSRSYEGAKSQKGSNHWSSTENNRNNARNVNFNNGVTNNNNKYNGNVVRAVTAFGVMVPVSFTISVWIAYHDCIRGKTSSVHAIEYMRIAIFDIPCLAYELWTGTYKPGTSTCFLVRYPKWREVFAANFRDRIVHHWICLRLEPLFEERFISQGNVSFNCRKGFGTDKAVFHLRDVMSDVSDNYHKPAWVFRGDLVGFFMSIDKDKLWYLLERFIIRWRKRYEREGFARITPDILSRMRLKEMPEMYWDILLRVTKVVVFHHPERDCIINSPVSGWLNLSPLKSLFTCTTGEPIGNLPTQLFANFLMSFFTMYVLFKFRRKNFGIAQFVDDFAIACDDLRFLLDSIPDLERFLKESLLLTLHKDKRYLQPVSHGILFVGTYIKPGRLYLSNRTLGRFYDRCYGYGELLKGEVSEFDLQHIEQVLNSYLGFCKHRETYGFRKRFIDSMGENFWKYFIVRGDYESIRVLPQYRLSA